MDEKTALAAAAQGDKEAFRFLVEAYQDRVFGHVVSMVPRRDQAEDLTQEIFVKAYFALPKFKRDSSFFTWLYRIARNHCLDFLRRKRPIEQPLDAPLGEDAAYSLSDRLPAPACDHPGAAVENEAELAELLNDLEPEQKQLLILRELEGFSYEELTEMLDCPMNTVKSRLNRAREALKTIFIRKYGPPPASPAKSGNILPSGTVKNKGENL
jgi:RNA polymerase sigma-70 factor (ECF subfamily)